MDSMEFCISRYGKVLKHFIDKIDSKNMNCNSYLIFIGLVLVEPT